MQVGNVNKIHSVAWTQILCQENLQNETSDSFWLHITVTRVQDLKNELTVVGNIMTDVTRRDVLALDDAQATEWED